MISNKTLKAYNFETLFNYFEYIIESKINSQHKQVENLIKDLSKEQKKTFLSYYNDPQFKDRKDTAYCVQIAVNQI